MGWKWARLLLVACAVAAAGDEAANEAEAAIRAVFRAPGALPGKLAYDEYLELRAAKGYCAARRSVAQFRPLVASYLGALLTAPA